MSASLDYAAMIAVALKEARIGLAEGGIPIGAAIFDASGQLLGTGRNRRVQNGDPRCMVRPTPSVTRVASAAIGT
jgi:cytosine deaminase